MINDAGYSLQNRVREYRDNFARRPGFHRAKQLTKEDAQGVKNMIDERIQLSRDIDQGNPPDRHLRDSDKREGWFQTYQPIGNSYPGEHTRVRRTHGHVSENELVLDDITTDYECGEERYQSEYYAKKDDGTYYAYLSKGTPQQSVAAMTYIIRPDGRGIVSEVGSGEW